MLEIGGGGFLTCVGCEFDDDPKFKRRGVIRAKRPSFVLGAISTRCGRLNEREREAREA